MYLIGIACYFTSQQWFSISINKDPERFAYLIKNPERPVLVTVGYELFGLTLGDDWKPYGWRFLMWITSIGGYMGCNKHLHGQFRVQFLSHICVNRRCLTHDLYTAQIKTIRY